MAKSLVILVSCFLLLEYFCNVQVEAIECYACEEPDCGPGETDEVVACEGTRSRCIKKIYINGDPNEYKSKGCVTAEEMEATARECRDYDIKCEICQVDYCF